MKQLELMCETKYILHYVTLVLTFLNCITKFIRLLVVFWACVAVVAVEVFSKSSILIFFFTAWYSSLCLVVSGQ